MFRETRILHASRVTGDSSDPVDNCLEKNECGADAGPCVSTEYSYDDNDRLLTENGYAYTYDNNGNHADAKPGMA